MLHKNKNGEPAALVTNIQKYTIHDGPGIRTAVFLKGCPMNCLWCSNPETISPMPQLGVYPAKCLSLDKCGLCLKACPTSEKYPIKHGENGVLAAIEMLPECDGCYKCADACPSRAIKQWGEYQTVPELMKIIEEDRSFYERGGGGVTLNGGEVMLQWELVEMLLRACAKAGINTCVETALNCPSAHMEAVFKYTDLVITDIKHMDSAKHRELTGAGNEQILDNIKKTVTLGKPLVIRTPVVFGYNGDEENIRKTGEFIKNALGGKIIQYQLLPYRKMGTEKYDSLGRPYPMGNYAPPTREAWEPELLRLTNILITDYALPAVAGSAKRL